jgi:hypothetical protein
MALEDVVKSSKLSFDVKKFMQPLESFSDYNDQLYQVIKKNLVGGSSAHPELIGTMCHTLEPKFE